MKLLTGGARDLPPRHQTLRGTVEWSYNLLTEKEQRLFARLSVFAGGCILDGAEAVCNAEGDLEIDVLDGLASLVDKSLLRQDSGRLPAPAGEPRFVMLETLREYAAERLEADGEAEQTRYRHAAYFISLAEEAEVGMLDAGSFRGWIGRLEVEHDNLRAAITWLVRTGQAAEAMRITGALAPFWNVRGYWREGRRWLEEALSAGTAPDAIRVKVQAAVGSFAGTRHGDYAYARAQLEEALTIYRGVGDLVRTETVLSALAITAHQQGDEQWRRYFAEAVSHLPEVPAGVWRAGIRLNLAVVAYNAGERVQAEQLFQEALAMAKQTGHEIFTAMSLGWLARLACDRGDLPQATALARQGLDIAHRGEYTLALMFCLEALAGVTVSKGEAEQAARLYGAVEALQQSTGGLLLPQILAKRQPLVEAARGQIGEEAWVTAWQEGRVMPLDEAVTLASDDANQVPTKPLEP